MRKTVAHSFPCNGTTSSLSVSYPWQGLPGQVSVHSKTLWPGFPSRRDASARFRRRGNLDQAVFRNDALRRASPTRHALGQERFPLHLFRTASEAGASGNPRNRSCDVPRFTSPPGIHLSTNENVKRDAPSKDADGVNANGDGSERGR